MSKLSAFLKPTPEGKKKEVILERFTDENGKVVPFVIKSIRAADNDSLVRKNTDRKTGKFNSRFKKYRNLRLLWNNRSE